MSNNTVNTTGSRARALFHTFGCKLNFAETSTIEEMLAERGIVRAKEDESPDIIVVNTCSVTAIADKKCRQSIRGFSRRWPDAAIVVTGCYAQLSSDEAMSLPGVAIVAGIDRKLRIAEYVDRWLEDHRPAMEITPAKDIREFVPVCSRGDRTRWFLKVQDGCDYFCSYCTIPYARGRSRSCSVGRVVAEAEKAAADGAKEIVITGVNIGDFGKDSDEKFLDLIKALDSVDGIERYRISSIEPNLLSDDIIGFVAESKRFMPHFHIPLQCGNDEVLKLMRRHYDTELFARRIEKIRSVMPEAFIGVDLIVGARGETAERYADSRRFVESLPVSRLHVFPYSERPGTRALEIKPAVSQEEKHRRAHEMMQISDTKLAQFAARYEGSERKVLIEHASKGGFMWGFTDNYIKVRIKSDPSIVNRIVTARIGRLNGEECPAIVTSIV